MDAAVVVGQEVRQLGDVHFGGGGGGDGRETAPPRLELGVVGLGVVLGHCCAGDLGSEPGRPEQSAHLSIYNQHTPSLITFPPPGSA